ncbi:thioesterase family protein [Pseudomonas sp. zfem002]|uniref:acyl-CoA thioesterase n=1 Tax=Pseudomonas sp. zfem002 TaxID=3078197 RepID=UPI002929962E|nr:thioesterase family protein [Pseudomonas sp. zfem002]MDU9392530.1 thioesterase family protein [Pseudomonas sp. zfem002]
MSPTALRPHYPYLHPLSSRWQDNDVNGQIVSATVYGFFDTALQACLIEHAGLDPQEGEVVGFVVTSSCDFYASAAFPDLLQIGVRVERLAGSSVEYALALFQVGQEQPCAVGRLVQVFIERQSGQPAQLPARLQAALEALRG